MINISLLEQIRKQKNISQQELALVLGFKGKAGYNNIAKGKSNKITPDRMIAIKTLLKLTNEQFNDIFFAKDVKESRTSAHTNSA